MCQKALTAATNWSCPEFTILPLGVPAKTRKTFGMRQV